MADYTMQITSTIFAILILSSNFIIVPVNSQQFSRKLSKKEMGRFKRPPSAEKLSHLHFYFHDIISGGEPTAVKVAESHATNSSATRFGSVMMIDDPLTVGPNLSSKIVGRAQGIYASADSTVLGFMMVFNYKFTEGEFNGSTISVLGRNPVFSAVRELSIVGGSGVFRFAHGHVEVRTHEINLQTGDAVIEHNVYVFHY